MDEAAWLRHANPWSVWTRFIILPMLALAIWSRVWIGWWSLALIIILAIWTRYNPHAFPEPKTTKKWASRAVMGERVWLSRSETPIPTHHSKAAFILSLMAGIGLPFVAFGLWQLSVWPTILGVFIIVVFKMWFLDRMVWLYDDMAQKHEKYYNWLR